MTNISSATPRIAAIRARMSQIEQVAAPPNQGAQLGFGLALQNAAAEAALIPASEQASVSDQAQVIVADTAHDHDHDHGHDEISTIPGAIAAASSPAVLLGTESVTGAVALQSATMRSGSYGRLEPPAELLQYGNGQVPIEALAPVGETGHHLYKPAADALNVLLTDAAAAGITIKITDSYRPLAVQVDLVERKGLYSQGGLAARPGTSNHGWGMSTDLNLDDSAQSWMRENAWRYGYVEDVPREPWHWTYRPDPS